MGFLDLAGDQYCRVVDNLNASPTPMSLLEMASTPSSNTPSRNSTPVPTHNTRFTPQSSTAEDLLKSQTVGLIHLSDYRKRRAEAIEQKEREAHDRSYGRFTTANVSGEASPSDG